MRIKSIGTKIFLSFLVIFLPAVLFLSYFSLDVIRKELSNEFSSKLALLAEAKEGQFFSHIDSLQMRTIDFSYDRTIIEYLKNQGEEKEDLSNYLSNPLKPLDDLLLGAMVIDPSGVIVAATDSEEIGKNKSDDEYFKQGMNGVFLSNLEKHGHFNEENAFVGSAPIKNPETGRLLGVIVNIFKTKKLEKIFSGEFQRDAGALSHNKGYSKTLDIYLVNQDKKIFAHPAGREKHLSGLMVNTEPVLECLNNRREIVKKYKNYQDKDVLGASMCLVNFNWVIVAEIQISEIENTINKDSWDLFLVFFIIIILMFLCSFVFSRRITIPLKKLNKAVKKLHTGDLSIEIDIQTKDEIGELSGVFNEMTKKLRKNKVITENKIKKRTAQLEKLNDHMVGRELKMIQLKKELEKCKKHKNK